MARAAAKGGKRPSQNARRQQQQRRPAASTGRRQLSHAEQNLFFSRIRRQAKWAYVLLAVLFAVTFAALGVGSGQGGLDQLFNDVFHGGSSGSSISKLESQTQKNPKDAPAWRQLALAYAAKQQNENAVSAMTQFTKLRPKDVEGWSQLGQFQAAAATADANLFGTAQAQANAWQSAAYNPFTPTGKLATAAGTSPAQQGVQSQASQAQALASNLQTNAKTEFEQAIASLQHAARLEPRSASGWNMVAVQSISALRQVGADPVLARSTLDAYDRLKKLDPASAKQYKQFVPTLRQIAGASGG